MGDPRVKISAWRPVSCFVVFLIPSRHLQPLDDIQHDQLRNAVKQTEKENVNNGAERNYLLTTWSKSLSES
jgi:hypothetical protein